MELIIKNIKSVLFLIIIVILTSASYFGSLILPLGLIILIITVPIGLILSITGIFRIIKKKKVNIITFTIFFIFIGVFTGYYQDYYTTKKTIQTIKEIKMEIKKYKINFNRLPTNDEINQLQLKYGNFKFENNFDNFKIEYKDATIFSDSDKVYLRPRP